MEQNPQHEINKIKVEAQVALAQLEAKSSAKEVAGKAIGKHGLAYITLIVIIGVGASLFLDSDKIAAVMGLLGASLTALISMLNGIAGDKPKEEKPEFDVMLHLIDRLDGASDRDPMSVEVEGEKVTVRKGSNEVKTTRGK